MLKLFLIAVAIYIVTIFVTLLLLRNESPGYNLKQLWRELQEVPVLYVPMLNTIIVLTYIVVEAIEKICKRDS